MTAPTTRTKTPRPTRTASSQTPPRRFVAALLWCGCRDKPGGLLCNPFYASSVWVSMRRIPLVLLFATASMTAPPGAQAQAGADTIPVIRVPPRVTQTEPIIIEGREFTVRELVRRAMQGERSKLAGHADAIYLTTTTMSVQWDDKKEVEQHVARVYGDSTGFTRRVLLATRAERFNKKNGDWVFDKDVSTHDDGYRIQDLGESRFTSIPVYLEHDEEFDFEFVQRTLEADRVVFHVRFKPKSDFSEMPKGEVWIDGKGYRVVHEIYDFTNNPFPLLIKGIRRVSMQWSELPGGEWVPRQVTAELDLRGWMPFTPHSVSLKHVWGDFRFDQGYDERLFGKSDHEPVAIAAKPVPVPAPISSGTSPASTDSSAVAIDSLHAEPAPAVSPDQPAMLAALQREDDAAYSPEVRVADQAFVDTTAARHDELGIAGLGDEVTLYGSDWQFGFDPQLAQWQYNRVEGFLFGGGGTLGRADDRSQLSLFGGYATGSEAFRYRAGFTTELPRTDRKLSLALSFRDCVEPFGSNRIALNSVRAFVGGADDQDYLHRVGGAARLVFEPWQGVSLDTGYEGSRERSIATDSDFSVWGNLDQPNPAVDEGDEHALVVGFHLGGWRWLNADITQRLAGGALGGDFRYARTDIVLNARGYPLGRQQFDLTLRGVTTGDNPPLQQLADIGGLTTVRGYQRRTHVGNHSFAARLEYLFPYDVLASTRIPLLEDLGLQFIPWADAGRVGEGDSQDWITSAGIGLQRYLWPFEEASSIRLDFAWPLDNQADDFAVYLWFVGMR